MSRKRVFGRAAFILAAAGLFILFQMIGVPLTAEAHGSSALEARSGDYEIVVSFEETQFVQDQFIRFNLNLISATVTDKEVDIPHTASWTRIEHDEDIIFAGWLYKPEGLLSGFSYAFPEAGEYRLLTRFVSASGTIAEGGVTINVIGDGISQSHVAMFLFGMIAGGILILTFGRRHVVGP